MKPRYSKRERRSRRPRHWVVGVCLVLIAAVWLASGWFVVYRQVGGWYAFVVPGRVGVIHFDFSQQGLSPSSEWHELAPFQWGFEFELHPTYLAVPLWFPFLAVASIGITREVLWRRHKPDPGHCSCGYPVAGLERCPECGKGTA